MEPGHGYWISTTTTVTLQYSTTLTTATAVVSSSVPSPNVSPTNQWVTFYSTNSTFQGNPAPEGAVVAVFADGVQCGEFTVGATAGRYGLMPCYRDDPTTPTVDEGAEPGDVLTFAINGVPGLVFARSLNGVPIVDPDTPITWSQNLDRWEVDIYVSPLAVDLAFFTAQAEGAAVRLTWETVSEVDHLGFNLYRGPAAAGPWTPLNDTLIVSPVPGSTDGQHYEWLDTDLLDDPVYWYQLEALDVDSAAWIVGRTSVQLGQTPPAQRIWLPLILQQPAAN